MILVVCGMVLSSCAATNVTPISRNQFPIQTSAAPACGRTGAAKVAVRMAAVETIRRGYQRFVVLNASTQNNVSVLRTGPTYATTTGNATIYGNTAYGNATTTYGGQQTLILGSNDSDLNVLALNPSDRGFQNGIDAKRELGPKWEELVKSGVRTCTD